MFEKLFVKTSDFVFHKIAPYAVERERFLEHCGEEGFSKVTLSRIAGIVVTAACDLHAHGGLDVQAPSPRPYAALLDDFERWMTEERGLSRSTLKTRSWHIGRFLDWLHEHHAPVPGLSPRDLDGYLNHLHAKRLSRVSIKSHTDAVRAFTVAEQEPCDGHIRHARLGFHRSATDRVRD
jgi:hypothetical protein